MTLMQLLTVFKGLLIHREDAEGELCLTCTPINTRSQVTAAQILLPEWHPSLPEVVFSGSCLWDEGKHPTGQLEGPQVHPEEAGWSCQGQIWVLSSAAGRRGSHTEHRMGLWADLISNTTGWLTR